MRTRSKFVLLLLLIVILLGVWFEPGQRVRGWVFGEEFVGGYPTSYWLKQLSSSDPAAQSQATWSLREAGGDAQSVLSAILFDDNASTTVRVQTAVLLSERDDESPEVVTSLLSILNQDQPDLRDVAIRGLGKLAPRDDDVLNHLLPYLEGPQKLTTLVVFSESTASNDQILKRLQQIVESDGDSASVVLALESLRRRKEIAIDAAKSVCHALKRNDATVREKAAETLGQIGANDAVVVDALVAALEDDDNNVQLAAIKSLGRIGPSARASLPKLRQLLNSKQTTVRQEVALTIRRVDRK